MLPPAAAKKPAKSTAGAAASSEATLERPEILVDFEVGESVTVTYQVKVNADVKETDTLVNAVVGSGDNPNNPDNPGVPSNCVTGSEKDCTTTHTPVVPSGPSVHTGGEALPSGALYAGLGLLVVGAAGVTFLVARRSRTE